MLDIKWIRNNKQEFIRELRKRSIDQDVEELLSLDQERRNLLDLEHRLRSAVNNKTKQIATSKSKVSIEVETLKRDVKQIKEKLHDISESLNEKNQLIQIINNLPNLLQADVPYGTNEEMNQFVRKYGNPIANQKAKDHVELGEKLGMMDFKQTAKISGSRFVTLTGDLARLERALINFMLDHNKSYNFKEVSPPVLVREEAMYNVGQLPKFDEDSYATRDNKHRLIPTGEVPLTNMVADMILDKNTLPIRYSAYTPCFRSEAGSSGKDTRGMIRNHQFGKVEIVSITSQDESKNEHESMLSSIEDMLKKLNLSYRVMLLCSGDTGFSSSKTYDIEVWFPSQGKYREISSVSNCLDFQARRMKARYRDENKDIKFVHSLNGSSLAVGRTLIAIMENYQNEDGSISVPEILVPYMGGVSLIK